MLYIEENLSFNEHLIINDLELNNYSSEELIYATCRLAEANYLNCTIKSFDDSPWVMVNSISFQGHQFLDNIRDDNVWNNSKQILSKFKSTSITFISDIASQIISNIISKKLGIT